MNITGLDKARVLKALYDHSKNDMITVITTLLGVDIESTKMSIEEARRILKEKDNDLYFDYLNGRVIKTDLGTNFLNLSLYDRDNGYNAGENAILDEFTKPVNVK